MIQGPLVSRRSRKDSINKEGSSACCSFHFREPGIENLPGTNQSDLFGNLLRSRLPEKGVELFSLPLPNDRVT